MAQSLPIVTLLTSPVSSLVPSLQEFAQKEPELESAFKKLGINTQWLEWGTDGSIKAAQDSSVILIRSTWDYSDSMQKKDEFLSWLDQVVNNSENDALSSPLLLNSLNIIEWNSDKRYLFELEKSGVPIVPSRLISNKDEIPNLEDLIAKWECESLILKPVVGGSARAISKHSQSDNGGFSSCITSLTNLLESDNLVIIQPFLDSVCAYGEISIVCFDNVVEYAALKKPKSGEFRVQSEWGGSVEIVELTDKMRAIAYLVLEKIPFPCAYARLDFLECPITSPSLAGDELEGVDYVLNEAELIEPDLFFYDFPTGSDILACLVAATLNKRGN